MPDHALEDTYFPFIPPQTTTNILLTPLAAKCSKPFTPANGTKAADALCCTTDITLAEYKFLCGKMDGYVKTATTPEQYVGAGTQASVGSLATPFFRTELYAGCGEHQLLCIYAPLCRSMF